MDLQGITGVLKLCYENVHMLEDSLTSYKLEVSHIHQVIAERWVNVERVDGRLIMLHDQLLSSLSEVNASAIKMNLQIKLNRPGGGMLSDGEKPEEPPSPKLSNRNAIEENEEEAKTDDKPQNLSSVQQKPPPEDSGQQVPIDLSSTQKPAVEEIPTTSSPKPKSNPISESTMFSVHSSWVIEPPPENLKPKPKPKPMPVQQTPLDTKEPSLEKPKPPQVPLDTKAPATDEPKPKSTPLQQVPQATKTPSSEIPEPMVPPQVPPRTLLKFPLPARNQPLLPPNSGNQTTSSGIYERIFKNIAAFPEDTVVTATVMHLNIESKNCFFVAKWDDSSQPLQKLLQGQVPLRELDQLPDFGEIFAVYDCNDKIIPRVTVSATADDGGYYAYLVDYGEHIHLSGYENIFAISEQIKQLPAEAVRCHLSNYNVCNMNKYSYKTVKLHILDNNGVDLVANLLEEEASVKGQSQIAPIPNNKPANKGKIAGAEPKAVKLSEADMAMLNEIGESTSDPLKAVLGFRPTDEQRLCRHYDPKIKGCFKGNQCHLVHEPFAPLGATKDVEVGPALPEAVFDTVVPRKLGQTARMLITFINSPIEVYAQFLEEGATPLVWGSKDVPQNKRIFKRKPHMLDIVLARYSDDCFYRAQVMDEQDGEYKIFYVDYGNTEFVYLNSLAPCDDVESLKPHRAISCHIEGVIRSPDLTHQKTAECVEYLKSKLLNAEVDVVLRQRLPDGFLVRLQGEYIDVPRQLVMRGYAQPSVGLQGNSKVALEDNGSQVEF